MALSDYSKERIQLLVSNGGDIGQVRQFLPFTGTQSDLFDRGSRDRWETRREEYYLAAEDYFLAILKAKGE